MTDSFLGKVFLVGAGPGDPGLITVAGAEALRSADVVIYDRLASPALLELALPAARRIFAGKGPDAHAMSQDEINAALVEHARAGKTVVRLKGGDPFVFGRGGEEAQALVAAGVPFEVIPGISSAIAAPAYAGIPVTHRGLAASVAFVTGHEDPAKTESAVDWEKLATAVDTIVLMMGAGQLSEIATRLTAAGRDPTTPVALIEWGTLPRQRTVTGTLEDIVAKAEATSIRPPAIAVIGDVVRLRDAIRWYDNKPLFGQRVLVTRTREQASELSRALSAAGAEAIELPALKIVARYDEARLAYAVDALRRGDYTWVCFTSTNAVGIFFGFLTARSLDSRAVRAGVAAIGPGTAESLRARGVVPDVVPDVYTAEGLSAAFAGIDVQDARVLLPRAENAREVLIDALVARGAKVDEVTLYVAEVPDAADADGLRRLRAGEIDIATFASSSTVKNLVALLGGDIEPLGRCRIACIGPVTAATAEELLGRQPDIVASEHTIEGLIRAIIASPG